MVPIFFINLDRDVARRQALEEQLSRAGLMGERIAGIDGRHLPEWARPYFPMSDLRPGEVGCYASHMLAWRTILDRRLPYALILEDDATLPPDLGVILNEIVAALPDGWDFVHLTGNPRSRPFAFRPLAKLQNGSLRLVRCSRIAASAAAYLISASGAAKMLREMPRTLPVDYDTRMPWKWEMDPYGIEPGPIRTSASGSTINAMGGHSGLRRGVIGGMAYSLRSPASVAFNIRKLGLAWWLWCLSQNAAHRMVRMVLGWRIANRVLPLNNPVRLGTK